MTPLPVQMEIGRSVLEGSRACQVHCEFRNGTVEDSALVTYERGDIDQEAVFDEIPRINLEE